MDEEITKIFTVIDNYGTNTEAREAIKSLLHQEALRSRKDELERLGSYKGHYGETSLGYDIEDRIKELESELRKVEE